MKTTSPNTPVKTKPARATTTLTLATALATLLFLAATGATVPTPAARAQSASWSLKDGYLAFEGKPMFLSGANYIPSREWYMILKNWDPATVEADMKAMHDIGVRIVRFPPLWPILQDDDGKIIEKNLDHLDQLLRIAHRNGIQVQVEFFTGGVDGATMLPKWAEGNIFTDPKIIAREKELVTAIVTRLKDNPGLFSYDFGNEINILQARLERGLKVKPTPAQMRDWMLAITAAAKAADPRALVAPGLAAVRSRDGLYNIWDIADATDYTSIHSWAYFDQTIKSDPWIGQRTLYNMNYGIAYNAMAGKPVMVQETGFAEWWIGSKRTVSQALRISLVSSWAQGACSFLWWGSHDTRLDYIIPHDKNATYSEPNVRDTGIMNNLEYSEGLIDSDNHPKIYGLEFKRWSAIIDNLGAGWKETLPIVYVLQPDDKTRGFPDKTQRTAFTLAKQTHMDVKLWPEWKPIPPDAAALVIAGFALTEKGKTHVARFLNAGGTVLQTWANDFAPKVVVTDEQNTTTSPEFLVAFPRDSVPMRNTLPFFDGEYLRVNARNLKLRNITSVSGPETRVLLRQTQDKEQTVDIDITTGPAPDAKAVVPRARGKTKAKGAGAGEGAAPAPKNRPVFTETVIGKGKYYYFAGNLEEALAATYNPWASDDSDKIYGALRPPAAPLDIDCKYVEFYAKERGAEKLLVLLNRSNTSRRAVVYSVQKITLRNHETGAPLGAGKEIGIDLNPGEVLMADVTK